LTKRLGQGTFPHMTIHVNIGEAKTRLSELLAASLRGEEVVLQKAGVPQARIVPIERKPELTRAEIAKKRAAAFGMFRDAFKGVDLSLEAFKAEKAGNYNPDRKFGDLFEPDL
jgi:prevent-host-death family protein